VAWPSPCGTLATISGLSVIAYLAMSARPAANPRSHFGQAAEPGNEGVPDDNQAENGNAQRLQPSIHSTLLELRRAVSVQGSLPRHLLYELKKHRHQSRADAGASREKRHQ
jgi:hypothetical protein